MKKSKNLKRMLMVVIASILFTGCQNSSSKQSVVTESNDNTSTSVQTKQVSISSSLESSAKDTSVTNNSKSPENESNKIEPEVEVQEVDYQAYFKGMNGSAIFYDPKNQKCQMYQKELCGQELSPCSTFKIIAGLTGIKEGVITSKDTKMGYNKKKHYPMAAWNKDLTFEEAFQQSCVWYFRKLIDQIGKEKMESVLNELHFGNEDCSEWKGNRNTEYPELSGFWLKSSLKISEIEWVHVLNQIFGENSKYSKETLTLLKEAMLVQTMDQINVYGKTGTGGKPSKEGDTYLGWFVGMIESSGHNIYFAVQLNDELKEQASGPNAKEIALAIIRDHYTL